MESSEKREMDLSKRAAYLFGRSLVVWRNSAFLEMMLRHNSPVSFLITRMLECCERHLLLPITLGQVVLGAACTLRTNTIGRDVAGVEESDFGCLWSHVSRDIQVAGYETK